jgi:hypothetical protein
MLRAILFSPFLEFHFFLKPCGDGPQALSNLMIQSFDGQKLSQIIFKSRENFPLIKKLFGASESLARRAFAPIFMPCALAVISEFFIAPPLWADPDAAVKHPLPLKKAADTRLGTTDYDYIFCIGTQAVAGPGLYRLPFYLSAVQFKHGWRMGMSAEYYPVGRIEKDLEGLVRIAAVNGLIKG